MGKPGGFNFERRNIFIEQMPASLAFLNKSVNQYQSTGSGDLDFSSNAI